MTTKTTTYGIPGRAGFRSEISGGAGSACVVVRRFLLILFLSALLTPLSTLFSACGHEDLVSPDVYVEETVPYVEVRIAVPLANPTATRANPMGGEEGNGRERGVLNEDKIHDINVFFYIEETKTVSETVDETVTEKVTGLGMDSDTEIVKHIYYNLDNKNDTQNSQLWIPKDKPQDYDDTKYDPYYEHGYVILKLQCEEEDLKRIDENDGINFVAVANVGPIEKMERKPLSDLRTKTLEYYFGTNTWTATNDAFSNNAMNMDYFLMSTAYNKNYLYGGQWTGDNKISKQSNGEYKGMTTLQRMYARLDLSYSKSNNAVTTGSGDSEKVTELKYQIKEKDKDETPLQHYVYITNVLPVNVMQKPSFLFKKVTSVNENWNTDNTIWNKINLEKISSFSWGGKESLSEGPVTGTSSKDLPINYVIERHTNSKLVGGGSPTDSLKSWYDKTAVKYVRGDEKFNNLDCSIKNSGVGSLTGYYHGIPASGNNTDERIAIIGYANENTQPTDCFHSNYLTGMAFRAVYVPDKIYDYSETTIDGKTSWALTEMPITTNPTTIYRYSPTTKEQYEGKSKYFTSKSAADNYAKDHPGDMAIVSTEPFTATQQVVGKDDDGNDVKKWGFVCYYNLWLRHYNNESGNPTENYPMEYATVRNNIYRVSVSFSGPGDPTPTMREPDTMKARIFVRKWNYKGEPTINFDLN